MRNRTYTEVREMAGAKRIRFYAHTLVAKTAAEMAAELYETLAKDNNWKKLNPELIAGKSHDVARRAFIERNTGRLLEQARATLAALLSTNIAESLKQEIADALIKDNQLRHNRQSAAYRI